MRARWWAAGLALAAASLALPSAPTYDPWAWLVFGREIVVPGPGFSTIASTGWKPLAVLFTAPLALTGSAAPSLWLVVVRFAGLAALALAFRLGARAGGPIAGAIAALALLPRPTGCATCRRATSSRWSWRSCSARSSCTSAAAATRRSCSARWPGWRVPRCGPSSGPMPSIVALIERRWWPLALGVPAMFALWIVPDWLGSGDLLHTFHLARISAEPVTLQGTGDPALELLRGAGTIAPAPVWIGALCGLAFGWRTRDRTVAALAFVAAAWAGFTVVATALGYPAVPRYLVVPVAICCVVAGIGAVAVVRLASGPRGRAVLAVALVAVSVPFAVSRADRPVRTRRSRRRLAPRSSRRSGAPSTEPSGAPRSRACTRSSSRAAWRTAWRGSSTCTSATSGGWFSPAVGIAFIEGDDAAVIARLRRRNATAVRLAAAGPWRVLRVRWGSAPQRRGAP